MCLYRRESLLLSTIILLIISAIGWISCTLTHYCPSESYRYEIGKKCFSNKFAVPPSIEPTIMKCDYYYHWMWSFIILLIVNAVLILYNIILSKCRQSYRSNSQSYAQINLESQMFNTDNSLRKVNTDNSLTNVNTDNSLRDVNTDNLRKVNTDNSLRKVNTDSSTIIFELESNDSKRSINGSE